MNKVEQIIKQAEALATLVNAVWDEDLEAFPSGYNSQLELFNQNKDEWDQIGHAQLSTLLGALELWREPGLHPLR